MDYEQLNKLAGNLTVVGLLITIIVLIMRGGLVTGREYTRMLVENVDLRKSLQSNAQQIEALKVQNGVQQTAMNSQQSQIDHLSRELESFRRTGGVVRT